MDRNKLAMMAKAKTKLAGGSAANYQPFDDAEDAKDNGADEATENAKAMMPSMPINGLATMLKGKLKK